MAALSAKISYGGGGCVVRSDQRTVMSRSSCVVYVANRRNRSEIGKISMTMTDFKPFHPPVKLEREIIGERKTGGYILTKEKLDEWLRDSVDTIVKNLRDSSLLVHFYAEANGDLTATAMNPHVVGDWEALERKWESGELPEGSIFVENLTDQNHGGACGEGTRVWGIVGYGKGIDCGPVRYLLKTTRVGSGMGSSCTHFCLVEVNGCRETAMSQLKDSWLVQTSQ